MKKITLLLALFMSTASLLNAQQGLEGVIVEKYYLSNSADSLNADNNAAAPPLRIGSVTYRVFIDMAPGYKFNSFFGNQDAQGNVLHPLIFKTTTDFYNDPVYGSIYPQNNSVNNTKKNTTLIDTWLSVGGVCSGKMGVPKTEDTDGSIGNSSGVLLNNPGGVYGAPINSVNPQAEDGMMPGSPLSPNVLGLGNATDIFDQTPGNTFSVTNGVVAALGGAVGTTSSNVILIGQFTTNGIFSFSLNIQIQNTVTGTPEVYVPTNPQPNTQGTEFTYTALAYSSAPPTGTVDPGTGFQSLSNQGPLLSVYPNPSKGIFTLNVTNAKESANNTYTVYDITGRAILTKNLGRVPANFTETIDVSDFSGGLYFLDVSIDGAVSKRKLIKE